MNIFGDDNLKTIKTKIALNEAFQRLLEKQSFEKIAVRNICEEAMISRTTFYAHFTDKYDFLRQWLPSDAGQLYTYTKTSAVLNKMIDENKKIIRNLLLDVRKETLEVLSEVILTTLTFSVNDAENTEKNIVISNFYAGGMLFYLLWQVEHKFPEDLAPVNEYLYEIMQCFQTLLDKGDM